MAHRGRESAREPLAAALAAGQTVRQACAALELGERTAHRWLADPAYRRRVDDLRQEAMSAAMDRLAAGVTGAVATILELSQAAEAENVRLAAARAVLEMASKLRGRAREHPIHAVAAAAGHTVAVAGEPHRARGSEDFDKMGGQDRPTEPTPNPTQHPSEMARKAVNTVQYAPDAIPLAAGSCESVQKGAQAYTYPAWIRTRNEGTKVPSVTNYTTG